jgi:hypothetical protein
MMPLARQRGPREVDRRGRSARGRARFPANAQFARTRLSLDALAARKYRSRRGSRHSVQGEESVKFKTRASALALATALGTAGLALPYVTPADAALKPSATCAKLSAPPLAQTGGKVKSTVASCTPAALKAGGGSITKVDTSQTSGTLVQTITWKNGKGTTKLTIKFAPVKGIGKCKAPYDGRVKITGSVKSSTGAAKKIIKPKEPVSASICAVTKAGAKQGQSTLEPGTKFKL